MKHYLHLYRHIIRFAFIKSMAYPQDFFVWSTVDTVWGLVNIGFFKLLLLKIPNISGWTFDQLVIPLGILQLLNAFIWGAMYSNMKQLVDDVNKGGLDFFLIRPADNQFLLSTRYLDFNLFPSLVIGSFLVIYGLSVNHVLTVLNLLFVLIALISGIVISYSVWFISVTFSMWAGRLQNIPELFPNSLDIARVPVAIFPPLIRFIFTFIIPFALIGFLPADVILGKVSFFYLAGPIAAGLILLFISHRFWSFALRHYSSASS